MCSSSSRVDDWWLFYSLTGSGHLLKDIRPLLGGKRLCSRYWLEIRLLNGWSRLLVIRLLSRWWSGQLLIVRLLYNRWWSCHLLVILLLHWLWNWRLLKIRLWLEKRRGRTQTIEIRVV